MRWPDNRAHSRVSRRLFGHAALAYDGFVESFMRVRTFALLSVLSATAILAGCSGGDEGDSTPSSTVAVESTPAPSATPLARVPDPILVTGTGVPGGGGSSSTEESVEYVVEAGDTLGAIADRFGVEADVIREANDIEDDFIFEGQTLIIPRGSAAGGTTGGSTGTTSTPTPTPPPSTDSGNTYTVQAGDTAFGIALEFDTTVEALAAANGMTEDEITDLQIGQVINLPSPQ